MNFATLVFKAYLKDQNIQHLGAALKRGGVKDLLILLPANKRNVKTLEEHFKKEGIPEVADWYIKKQSVALKENIRSSLKTMCQSDDPIDEVRFNRTIPTFNA